MSRKVKKTCLLFGEGASEKKFFNFLINSNRFKNKYPNWKVFTDNAWGSSCRDILNKCINVVEERNYDLIICFIDTDNLQADFGDRANEEKDDLERIAREKNIKIIWQDTNHEEELAKASDGRVCTKAQIKRRLNLHSETILRSEFVKNILSHFGENY